MERSPANYRAKLMLGSRIQQVNSGTFCGTLLGTPHLKIYIETYTYREIYPLPPEPFFLNTTKDIEATCLALMVVCAVGNWLHSGMVLIQADEYAAPAQNHYFA
ncbi:MAG: hypothetical protein ACJAWC_002912 [Yoonia sp.]|jgi:hypothetical protein